MIVAKIPVIVLLVLLAFCSKAGSFWKIETESGEEILLSIEINTSDHTFKAFTRKDAIKDIAGFFAYNLAHAAGKLKYPEIVYIEGYANQLKDSLNLDGIFYYTDKKYNFQATLSGNSFRGKYTDNKNRVHRLTGVKQPDGKPIRNYSLILEQVIAFSEKYFPNPEWLKTSEWKDFKEVVGEFKSVISDDYELGALVMWHSRKFSFSPFDIEKSRADNQKQVRFKPQLQIPKQHVGLLNASQLPWTQKQMDSLAVIISKQSIAKLIIDLKGRSSITLLQARFILNYVCSHDKTDGAFVSRRYQNLHPKYPNEEVKLNNFNSLQELPKDYQFTETEGVRIDVNPAKQKFSGELYILTDAKTSNVAEVLAGVLQLEKRAKIVGQKTAGKPHLIERIKLADGYELLLTTGVYTSKEGTDILRSGVNPDVFWKENTLNYLLKTF